MDSAMLHVTYRNVPYVVLQISPASSYYVTSSQGRHPNTVLTPQVPGYGLQQHARDEDTYPSARVQLPSYDAIMSTTAANQRLITASNHVAPAAPHTWLRQSPPPAYSDTTR